MDTNPVGLVGLVNNIRILAAEIPVSGPENVHKMMLIFQGLEMLHDELEKSQKGEDENVHD